jgi:hypothetical protein
MNEEHILNYLRKDGIEVTFKINSKDLLSFLEQVALKIHQEPPETYLSPKKVCEMLDIHICTLWRWRKIEYLLPLKIGGQIRYKRSTIEKLLQKD